MPIKDPKKLAAYKREHYLKNREKYLARSRAYREQFPERAAAAKKRCYDRVKDDPDFKKKMSDYGKGRRSEDWDHVRGIERRSYYKHRPARLAYQKAHSKTAERKAREAVNREIREGRLARASEFGCSECGKPAREYHHLDYSPEKWLDVVPVCPTCHKAIHRNAA